MYKTKQQQQKRMKDKLNKFQLFIHLTFAVIEIFILFCFQFWLGNGKKIKIIIIMLLAVNECRQKKDILLLQDKDED